METGFVARGSFGVSLGYFGPFGAISASLGVCEQMG